jgi:zinc protease
MQNPDRKKAPLSRLVEHLKKIEFRLFHLSNGIPVYLIDEGEQEVLKIELVFRAGNFYQHKKHQAKAANALLASGTARLKADQISEHFDFYGAYTETHASKDNAYVGVYTLNKHLGHVLPLLAEIVIDPVFREEEIAVYRFTRKQHLNLNLEKVKYLARVGFNEQIFGSEHPYGQRLQAYHLDDLSRDDLIDFHQKHYRANNCNIMVSGKIPPDIEKQLENAFAAIEKSDYQPIAGSKPDISSSEEQSRFVEKPGALQAALRIGKPAINRLHPEFPELFILNTMLGGYFGSRLMMNIREDKGYTYGISSALASLQHSGLFVISSEVGTDVLEDAKREIYLEIKKMQDKKPGNKELDLVRNYLLGALMRSFDGPFALAERLRTCIEFGQTPDYYIRYAEIVRSISALRIQELAGLYFERDTMFETVAGGSRK